MYSVPEDFRPLRSEAEAETSQALKFLLQGRGISEAIQLLRDDVLYCMREARMATWQQQQRLGSRAKRSYHWLMRLIADRRMPLLNVKSVPGFADSPDFQGEWQAAYENANQEQFEAALLFMKFGIPHSNFDALLSATCKTIVLAILHTADQTRRRGLLRSLTDSHYVPEVLMASRQLEGILGLHKPPTDLLKEIFGILNERNQEIESNGARGASELALSSTLSAMLSVVRQACWKEV